MTSPDLLSRLRASLDARPSLWLALGATTLALSQLRYGLGALAWIAPALFLRFLRLTADARSRALFALAYLVAWIVAMATIVTDPLPWYALVGFFPPVAVLLGAPYLAWSALRSRMSEPLAALAFASLGVCAEWTLHALLPFGTWGSAANTQLDQPALLQLASVTGLHGISFLVYLGAALLEGVLDAARPARIRRGLAFAGALAVIVSVGQARLALSSASSVPTRRVAAVGTDATFAGLPVPSDEELAAIERGLVERTRRAARDGAGLVVWTEGATLVHPHERDAFHARIAELAGALGVEIVAGYIVPISLEPFRYENQYAFFTRDGRLDHVYDKHHPVPGEPATPGTAPLPVVETPEGRVSGALCYDYDFPRLGLGHAALDVDLVALPSSDWRGIDPIHTQMAAVRAIEGGQSIVRSTRFGLAAGIDPYGRLRGWASHWDDPDRVLVVELPRARVPTIYGVLGDWLPLASALFVLYALARALRPSTLGHRAPAPA